MVHNSMADHPERPRIPPKPPFLYVHKSNPKSPRDVFGMPNCEEKYSVPVIWHIITSSKMDGYVSNKTVEDAMNVLNGEMYDSFGCSIYASDSLHHVCRWLLMRSQLFVGICG